ncbi:MAG: DinB family protein [Candidatus Heimdallarchaeota archaeon]
MTVRKLFSHWDEVRNGLEKALMSLRPELLEFRPSDDALTTGEIFRHIAGAEVFWIQKVALGQWEVNARFSSEAFPTQETILELLRRTHQPTLEYLESLDLEDLHRECTSQQGETFAISWIIWHTLEHEIHYKGQIFRDLRARGQPVNQEYGP